MTYKTVRRRTNKRGGGLSPLSPTPHLGQKSKSKSKKSIKHNYLKQALLFTQSKAQQHRLTTPKRVMSNKTQRKPVNFKKLDSRWSQRIEKELEERERKDEIDRERQEILRERKVKTRKL
jgi:hypothetical protein